MATVRSNRVTSVPSCEFVLGDSLAKIELSKIDTIIISFPPREGLIDFLQNLFEKIQPKQKIVFLSSISVYANGVLNEDSPRNGSRFRGENLIEIENVLLAYRKKYDLCILRLGGIVDQIRNPVNFFSNEALVLEDCEINLVHSYDVASAIHFIIKNNISNEDFSVVANDHPLKSYFYGEILKKKTYSVDRQKNQNHKQRQN